MEDSFFGFNTSLPGLLDEELHDEPGQGLDEEEEEEYDALNDETFGTDAVEGDWEEDHEKLAEITEQSRARCGSYGNDGAERSDEAEHDTGLELEASLAQLVLEDYEDDVIVENGTIGGKLQNHRQESITTAENYSSSAPSGYSVWTPTKHENHLQSTHPITPSILPGKNVVSVEELERGLLSQQHNQHSQALKQQPPLIVPPPPGLGPPAPSSVLRLEDVERDLTANASLPVHLSRGQTQIVQHPDMVLLRNTQNAAAVASLGRGHFPGRLPPPPKAQVLPLGRGQVMLPGGRLVGPSGVHPGLPGIPDLRQLPQQNHRLMGSAPNLLRFIPPHLMVPPGQGQGGKGIPHPAGFPGDNGLLFPNHPLGHFRPGIPHVDQHRPGGQGLYGPRQDRQGAYFSNNRNGGPNTNYQHPNRGAPHHHHYNHSNRGGYQSNQEYDEYAGLMTTREKHWLLNIQILQLNTDRPHIDDYYYTVFQSRQPKSEQDRERDRKRDVHRERRDSFRDREPRQDSQPRVYTPAQFENSLGKLQIGSVTAPRKIIDMDVVSTEGLDTVPTSNQRDTKRAKQVLLEIERLYLLLLQIEDLSSTLPGVRESVTEEKPVLIQRIMTSLIQEDRIISVMSIRKGKMLILRLLPHLPATDNGPPQILTLWSRLLRGLVTIGRRDQGSDAVLPRFHPYFHNWVTTLPFAPLLQLVCSMLPAQGEGNTSTPTPTRTTSPVGRNVLSYAFSNKFGVSALASMLSRAEALFPTLDSSQQQDWKGFLSSLFETAAHVASPESLPAPLEPLSTTLASQHFERHECVHIERYALLERIFTRRDSVATAGDKSNENLA
ncbi:PAT1-like protein 1 [Gryllus bimaculatus]|nr:PAT1-like protein 1 [Gryllus bimaculatus]